MRRLFILFALLLSALVSAQQQMEIIPLRHQTVEQVLPVLQPLLEPGASLSGMSGQLIIRASQRNLEELRQVLSAIDRPARRLMIHVSQNRELDRRQQAIEVSGNVALGDNARLTEPGRRMPGSTRVEIRHGSSSITTQAVDSQRSGDSRTTQSVQVIDGGQAFIQVGRSLPLPLRQIVRTPGGAVMTESIVYQDLGQGFHASPRLVGERVTLEISPRFDTPGTQGSGSARLATTQSLSTTITGRLGEWIELGGSHQQATRQEGQSLGRASGEMRDSRSIWLRVEELP